MGLRNVVYWVAVVVAAMSLFMPLLVTQIGFIGRLFGSYSPVKSLVLLVVSILVAYVSSPEPR